MSGRKRKKKGGKQKGVKEGGKRECNETTKRGKNEGEGEENGKEGE